MDVILYLSLQRLQCTTSTSQSTSNNYRPAVILPGLGNNSGDYQKLEQTLKDKYGVPTMVAKVARLDWFRNAAGLVDPNYWRGTLQPRPVLDWYLKRVDDAVQQAKDLSQGQDASISLIGHSAGGWLARLYLEEFELSKHVSLLLTLGTPHSPPPKGTPGVIDQTRGLLDYVEKNCSKAVYTPQLKYVCIAGRYIQGAPLLGKSNAIEKAEFAVPEGEGVDMNPESGSISAHLDGALNICLDGVYHSPVGSDDALRPWYGSPAVLDQWIQHLLH
ncbi:hypothetical protein PIB30_049843 [Stylosanthes scabra]|uniref:GPI inositol-deacylase n=1 Tax=Stylosanthes scabra TaxID=79078 RepID=A0ABU6YIM2_9FABA|nr:hypothetical protein [Stylosanthes scabra]